MAGLHYKSLLAALVLVCSAYAHTHIRNLVVDGKTLDRGLYIRPYPEAFNFPVKGTDNPDLVCRSPNMNAASTKILDVKAGSTITLEFHEDTSPTSRGINEKHLGPCTVAMSDLSANGAGNVWFYIFKQGYDPATKKWCIDTINANRGKLDVTIPANIPDGEYLLRGEIIALHLASRPGGVEFYPNCVQIRVSGGSGTTKPKNLFAIPGVYQQTDKSMVFNVNAPYTSYPLPGPPVFGKSGSRCTRSKKKRAAAKREL
ncbi:hypothetical protein H4R18_005335 [Coemansia javaensis]|uniref:AA9 family lytic polysaccharide monooxygenase n=1 Tax=Coemansia javaensis TaxID=2761396 RepID=A0A9W8H2V2_9FUNG|nr:hypothetical protein H4R18_005335 [Coemansia javaensis]